MTTQVVHITRSVDREIVRIIFKSFANRYGSVWTGRLGPHGDWHACEDEWFEDISKFEIEDVREGFRASKEIFNKGFPPTLDQFIDLCQKASGIPNEDQIVLCMINRDFNHPIIKIIYDKIGSWKLSNGTEKEIEKKTKDLYSEAVIDFNRNKKEMWEKLENFNNDKLKQLPTPDKLPSTKESAAFKECMAKCQDILKGAGAKAKTYRHFDEAKISPSNNEFDQTTYDEFRDYLLSIPETETMTLPPNYVCRRMKFLSYNEQPNFLRKAGYNPNPHGNEKNAPRGHIGPFRVYQGID